MNTNLNNIPLEIYVDYISEYTQQEWTIEHILTLPLYILHKNLFYQMGDGYRYEISPYPKRNTATGSGCQYSTKIGKGSFMYANTKASAFGFGRIRICENAETPQGNGIYLNEY